MECVQISSPQVPSGRVFPGFGNPIRHRGAAAAQMQELEDLIERSRIAASGVQMGNNRVGRRE